MDWWMAGLALSALVGLASWDVGRPAGASAPALMALRAVGGLGLTAMAALALAAGSGPAASIAAVAAAPLLIGLTGGVRRPRAERAPIARPAAAPTPARRTGDQERRAA